MENLSTIYIIQDGKDRGTNIYKIGKTDKQFKDRFSSYSNNSIVYETYEVDSSICNKIEMYIIRHFKNKYTLEKGREWFSGNVEEMKKDISNIIHLQTKYHEEKTEYKCNEYKCNFCNTEFNSISSLNYHKKTSKYCLKIQEKDTINEYYQYKCDGCNKSFLSQRYLNKHLVSCAEKYEKELDSYKDKFLELEQKYNKEVDSYKEQLLNKVKENDREIHNKDMEIYSLKLKVILLEKEVMDKEKQKNDIKVILDKSLDTISNITCSK